MRAAVLMYHDIKLDSVDIAITRPESRPYTQRKSEFCRQMTFLHDRNVRTVRVCDLYQSLFVACGGETKRPRETVAITFDDGDGSNFDHALDTLLENGLVATFFVTTNWIGKKGYLTWGQIRELYGAGMEIGSHTMSHPMPCELTPGEFSKELVGSRMALADGLGEEIRSFSLPTGYYNREVKKLARDAGYSFVCTSRPGFTRYSGFDPYDVPRIAIKRGLAMRQFSGLAKCNVLELKKRQVAEACKSCVKKALGSGGYETVRTCLLKALRR